MSVSNALHCHFRMKKGQMATRKWPIAVGDVVALVRSHMIGLIPFKRTIERTTETMPLAPKQ